MSKSILISITAACETILAAAVSVLTAIVFVAAWKEHMRGGGLTAALIFGGTILGMSAAAAILASTAMWTHKTWGWELALLTNGLALVLLVILVVAKYLRENVSPNLYELGVILTFLFLVVLRLSGPVRNFFSVRTTATNESNSAEINR